jgi:non-ribosomal peptide synthetase component F
MRLSYRDLNARANALARRLMAGGFRRGDLAVIALPPSPQLAIAELAVLKAGGAYACPVSRLAYTVATPLSVLRDGVAYGLDIALPRSVASAACPNLPVLVREEDPACVLADAAGALTITVRHGSIVDGGASPATAWTTEAAPYAHWSVLMTGGTLRLAAPLPSNVLDPAA